MTAQTDTPPLRIVQWTTGIVGGSALRAIIDDPRLELVGCYAHSGSKVGVDAGVLAGGVGIGVTATNDVQAVLDLRPDCVVYMPQWPDISELETMLRAGLNVVTSARLVTGAHYPDDAGRRLRAAALAGGSSLYGSGCNPMHVPTVALAATAMCRRVDHVRIVESVDCGLYSSAGNWQAYGYGTDMAPAQIRAHLWDLEPDYLEALDLVAEALGQSLDDHTLSVATALANEDRDLGFMTIPKGTVAALDASWTGLVRGEPLVELRTVWKLGSFLGYTESPDWKLLNGYRIEVCGEPNLSMRLAFSYPDPSNIDVGITTAMPVVNAIPAVCAAAPGVLSATDLPLVTGRCAAGSS